VHSLLHHTQASSSSSNKSNLKENPTIKKNTPGGLKSDVTEETLDPPFHELSNLVMTDVTDLKIDPLPPSDSVIISDTLCALEVMRIALDSLTIHNWSLFV
jgi:hypothetical protein